MTLLDRHADWIARIMRPANQRRAGVVMVYTGLTFFLYLPFSDEPPIIYVMSALAIVLTGVTGVIAAVPTKGDNQ